jgi:N utilization substance protein B
MEEAVEESNIPSVRTDTRLAAIKALYASEINDKLDITKGPGQLTVDIIEYYHETEGKKKRLDQDFLISLIQGVCEHRADLDASVVKNLTEGWKLERLGPVLRCILRASIFELMNFSETPLKVIINEYVNITRSFFDEKEVGFVNGILDKIAHEVRPDGDE